jgi:hypothetical protein
MQLLVKRSLHPNHVKTTCVTQKVTLLITDEDVKHCCGID